VNDSPVVVLYDAAGNPVVVTPAGALKVDGSAATQPVSGSINVANFPLVQPVVGSVSISNSPVVSVDNFPGTQSVSGTVSVLNFPAFPDVQPVSGTVAVTNFPSGPALEATLTDGSQKTQVTNFPATQQVAGTVTANVTFPATQPISGSVVVSNLPATQPVSGAVAVSNLPSTQPISGSVSVSNLPATQPVSGTVTVNVGTTGGLALESTLTDGSQVTQVANFPATQQVAGTVTANVTFPATQPVSGTVTANVGTTNGLALDASVTALSAKFGSVGQKSMAASAPVVIASDQSAIPVAQPALTKGVQGASGVTTQDLKDAGRVIKTYVGTLLAGSVAEALITLTPYADFVAGIPASSFGVTAGKRLRLQSIVVAWRNTTAAAGSVTVRFRVNAGVVLATTPTQLAITTTAAAAAIGDGNTVTVLFPDGMELSGAMQFGLTQMAKAVVVGFDVTVVGYEY
jgi:hypothetical protein